MGNEIEIGKLGDVAMVRSGYAFNSSDMGDTGIPIIKIRNINPPNVNIKEVDRVACSVINGNKKVAAFKLFPGDILIAMTGATVGKVGRMPRTHEDYYLNQRVGKVFITNSTKADYDYLYYVLSQDSHVTMMLNVADGSAQANISGSQIETLEIPLHNLDVQHAIARVLGALDDKIELLRSMNETLEAMARALFKSWFVDFDPVRRKAEGKPTGLPPEIDSLFPDSFEDSELGEIPKGWKVKELTDVFDITMGQSPPGDTYNETGNGIPFYQGRTDFGFRFPTRRLFCNDPKRLAREGDTLVSVRAPVGDMNIANEKCCIGRGVASVRHRSSLRSFTYYCLNSLRESFYAFEAEGTVFGSINQNDFYKIKCVFGSQEITRFFDALTSPMDDEIISQSCEISLLEKERDSLLPRLISGDLELSDDMISKILEKPT